MKSIWAFLKANAWLPIAVLVLAVGLFQFVDPAPPKEITIATGPEEGRYYEMGKYLQRELAKEGVQVELVVTAGSSENLELLTDSESPVAMAFVQSGMEAIFDAGEVALHGLGSLYYEPIWVFRRGLRQPPLLNTFHGLRVAVGEPGSGTRAIAQYLLANNGLLKEGDDIVLVEKGGEDVIELLIAGEVDAAFFNVSAQSDTISQLIAIEGLELMDIRRSASYAARFPSLSSVLITEGLLDLERNIPDTDRRTLASVATLVVNDRFHPSFTPLVLDTLTEELKSGGMLEHPDEFPSKYHVGYDLTKEAEHFFEYGPPFLIRYLPFWAASLVDRLVIFVIPLLVILVPLSKVAGPLYRWRIRSRIYRWYRHLLETDRKIKSEPESVEIERERSRLRELATEIATIEVPLSYADELYHLKRHVEDVIGRLDALERAGLGDSENA